MKSAEIASPELLLIPLSYFIFYIRSFFFSNMLTASVVIQFETGEYVTL